MRKIKPHIMIWRLDIGDEDGRELQTEFFLTEKGIKRFLAAHEKELKEQELEVTYGQIQLWL